MEIAGSNLEMIAAVRFGVLEETIEHGSEVANPRPCHGVTPEVASLTGAFAEAPLPARPFTPTCSAGSPRRRPPARTGRGGGSPLPPARAPTRRRRTRPASIP